MFDSKEVIGNISLIEPSSLLENKEKYDFRVPDGLLVCHLRVFFMSRSTIDVICEDIDMKIINKDDLFVVSKKTCLADENDTGYIFEKYTGMMSK